MKNKHPCPCCEYKTIGDRGGFEICPICFWEDDGQDDADADEVRGGPNELMSLTEARQNFRRFGAADEKFVKDVRRPKPDET